MSHQKIRLYKIKNHIKHFFHPYKEIDNFNYIKIRISGSINSVKEYQIIKKENKADISLFDIYYEDGKEKSTLKYNYQVEIKDILNLLNKCNIYSWDKFNKDKSKKISDGEQFNFVAVINSNIEINAAGNNAYPKHFHELINQINNFLR